MTQLVPLAPGQYRLAWSARDEAGAPRRRLVAVVACDAGSHDWIAAAPQRAPGAFAGQFTVDDACAARWLSFAILPGAGVVSFGDVSLQRSP
jgi:hypothetical protein